MTTIANNTKVIVTTENNQEFKGTVVASGSQAQVLMYAVLLDEPESYPNIETGVKIVEVAETQVKLDTEAIFGKNTYVDVSKPKDRTIV
jgi:small nuclear ribonucleoprotein (snRNP)-like protein